MKTVFNGKYGIFGLEWKDHLAETPLGQFQTKIFVYICNRSHWFPAYRLIIIIKSSLIKKKLIIIIIIR